MKTIKIGIMSQKEIRERTLAIAQGKYKPKPDEPKIWFTSIRSLAEVLSDENQALLQIITDKKPGSIRELADITGRQSSNLSRTLKTLSAYGFVKLEKLNKIICPITKATTFNVIFGVHWEKHASGRRSQK
ncbi:MAG: transcriptional regulator [Gammaproteobacteria bacterium RIFCSPHIGHO2_12_FULL_37_34]|nr:MAG: transcriptional regulator [Gammaproteobacteria bacterium RIFCSPHIGHO2_12_FULL_37_34]